MDKNLYPTIFKGEEFKNDDLNTTKSKLLDKNSI